MFPRNVPNYCSVFTPNLGVNCKPFIINQIKSFSVSNTCFESPFTPGSLARRFELKFTRNFFSPTALRMKRHNILSQRPVKLQHFTIHMGCRLYLAMFVPLAEFLNPGGVIFIYVCLVSHNNLYCFQMVESDTL